MQARRLLAAALGSALVALLASCSPGEETAGFTVPYVGPADVDVDTPGLREAKARAGVEDCPEGAGRAGSGELPELVLPCLGGGREVDLSTLRGPLVISLWATSCIVCREEMPVLQAFHESYGDQVPLLGIDFQDVRPDDAVAFLDEHGATYPQLADVGGDVNGAAPIPPLRGLPLLMILDEDGDLAYRGYVIIETPQQLRELVEDELGALS